MTMAVRQSAQDAKAIPSSTLLQGRDQADHETSPALVGTRSSHEPRRNVDYADAAPGTEVAQEPLRAGSPSCYLPGHVGAKRASPGDDMVSRIPSFEGDERRTRALARRFERRSRREGPLVRAVDRFLTQVYESVGGCKEGGADEQRSRAAQRSDVDRRHLAG